MGVGRFVDWVAINATGASGGSLIFWDSGVLQLVDKEESQSSLSCKFRNCEDNLIWIFTGIYGPTTREGRNHLWEDLGAIRGLWREPWCIRGDFNEIRFPTERYRERRIMSFMRRFSHIMDELDLKDLPLQGGMYTRKGGLNNQRMARLDRYLITDD